jgi:3-methyladenine DNA glycosylase AlkD
MKDKDLKDIQAKLQKLADPEQAKTFQTFFKTGPGEYGEGDLFLGIRAAELRKLAKAYQTISIAAVFRLLDSQIHEKRMLALLILIRKFEKGSDKEQKEVYGFYLKNIRFVNNWDLVDVSAGHIVGAYLMDKNKAPLYRLAQANNLWERRIAIVATFPFIKQGGYSETLKISKILLQDKEDLIQKAVGWMLREVGKRDLVTIETFLDAHYRKMPRTLLRYAIEKFPELKRQRYLKGEI